MELTDAARQTWSEVQKKHSVPVNLLGIPIKTADTLARWKAAGMEKHVKQG